MRNLVLGRKDIVLKELERIGVDANAFPIFMHKADHLILKFDHLSCAQAHILKQVALICGADLAIPKVAYRGGKNKKFSAILFANRREIEKIDKRLTEQPWMESISKELRTVLAKRPPEILKIGTTEIIFDRTYIMGVINVASDSFYSGSRYTTSSIIEKVVKEMEEEGADFIDIGAESTRPEADAIGENEEIERLRGVLPTLLKNSNIPISVDTYKAGVAAYAIDQGIDIINDISGLSFDRKMARVIAKNKVSVVIMHIRGAPKTMQINPEYDNLMGDIYDYLEKRVAFATQSGISRDRIIIDPGLGFGKKLEDNYEIIRRLGELTNLNRPILVGHSRKSFIGNPFNLSPEQRLEGSLGVEALLIKNGVSILRVHDVLEAKKVAMLIDKIER